MSELRSTVPMLRGFTLGQAISDHNGTQCFPAMRTDSEKRYIVKKISLPASQVQASALLLTGVCRDEQAVEEYYKELALGICEEARTLDRLAGQRGFVSCQSYQMQPMDSGVGYEVWLLSRCRQTLERNLQRGPMTHLSAVNLGIDLCAALSLCREAGWIYADLKPENIFLLGDQEFRIGDLGFLPLDTLDYASLPDRYRSIYTAPEVTDAYSNLNGTLDTYALGLVLYQIYNGGALPFADGEERKQWLEDLAAGTPIAPPAGADEEMARIICKAIALNPADRWQTPSEMGHALIGYMKRSGAEETPIVLRPREITAPDEAAAPPEPEAVPAETGTAPETEAAPEAPAAEEAPAGEEAPIPVEEAPAENTPAPKPKTKAGHSRFRRAALAFLKKLLRTLFVLALLAGLAHGAWYCYQNFYLQTIDDMTYTANGNRVVVSVETAMDESGLTVICKDTYGNAVTGYLENGTVVFDRLLPSSQYIFTLQAEGFHKLVGPTSLTYSTPAETKVLHLSATTGQESGCAIISFGVEGPESESWTLTCAAEGEEQRTVTFSGHTVTLTDLTVGAEYTITLSAGSDILLTGETSMTYTAAALIQAENLALSDYTDGSMVFTWTVPEGAAVDYWLVRCSAADGYDRLQEVTTPRAVFTDITDGTTYTLEVTAAGMTVSVRTAVTADSGSISGFSAVQEGSGISLSWYYGGTIPEGGWKILWTVDGGAEQLLTADRNSAAIPTAAPGSSYTFTLMPPEGSTLRSVECTLQVPAAPAFSSHGLTDKTVIVKSCAVPADPAWDYNTLLTADAQSVFAPGGSMALLYTVTKPYTINSAALETLFVIRDSAGRLVSTAAHTRAWNEMWDNGYCVETVTNLPTVPGSYTLTVILGGGILAAVPFTVQ